MDTPEIDEMTYALPLQEVREFMAEYFGIVCWKQSAGCRSMDVGCGLGYTTIHILLPILPHTLKELVATDPSPEMVQHARTQCEDERVKFEVLDIATTNPPDVYHQRFDLIFSFFFLHWIQDQRQAMTNIFEMLQPGGDTLLLFFTRFPNYDVILKLAAMERWKPYMEDAKRYECVYRNDENVEETLTKLLKEVGFERSRVQVIRSAYMYESVNVFLEVVKALDPFLPQLPEHLRDRYRQNLCNIHRLQAYTEDYLRNDRGCVFLPHTLIKIHATKP